MLVQYNGSSPHTWGIHFIKLVGISPLRFIPTYVGHTISRVLPGGVISVHPHIRGAYKITSDTPEIGYGSSPHTWGIRILTHVLQALARFIPTYVGHTGLAGLLMPNLSVHPHIRGAYHPAHFLPEPDFGSSPHTWGIPCSWRGRETRRRFIPTYVGHTRSQRAKKST